MCRLISLNFIPDILATNKWVIYIYVFISDVLATHEPCKESKMSQPCPKSK